MDIIFELTEKHRSPEKVIRKLIGDSASINGRQKDDNGPAIWLAQPTEGGHKLSVVTLSTPEDRVLIWCSAASAGAGSDTRLAFGAVGVVLAPLVAVIAGFLLGAGWWSLALAPAVFVLGTMVLLWRLRSGGRKRAMAANAPLHQTTAQIEDLFATDAARVEHWPERDCIDERACSLRIDVEMMEKYLSKAERCNQRGDAVGKHVQLQRVVYLIENGIEPNSDLFRLVGRLAGATEADFPRVDSSEAIDEESDAVGASATGAKQIVVKRSVEELEDAARLASWIVTQFDMEYGGYGVTWHDRALICGADGIFERSDGNWYRIEVIDEDGDDASVHCVSALVRRVGPHYIVAADNGVYDVDVFTGKTRTIYGGDCFWYLGRSDDGTIYAGGDKGLAIVDAEGRAKVAFEGEISVVAANGSDVFVSNSQGLFKRNGQEWSAIGTQLGLPESVELQAMHPLGDGRLLVLGNEGTVSYFDGNSWTVHAIEDAPELRGIWADDSDSIVVVGAEGFVSRYDGKTWTRIPVGTDAQLCCVVVHEGEYIIGTDSGIIELRRQMGFVPASASLREGESHNPR